MNIHKKYSRLHQQLRLKEYSIPFKKLDEIKTKDEFLNYVKYFQFDITYSRQYAIKFLNDMKNEEEYLEYIKYFKIDKRFLLYIIYDCKHLNFLHEYMKDDIVRLVKNGNCNLNDEILRYINKYIPIIELNASYNPNITTVEPFANTLKVLYARSDYGDCGINDDGLQKCNNLENLDASYNSKITTIEPFANTLKILNISNGCYIRDIERGINLQEIINKKIE